MRSHRPELLPTNSWKPRCFAAPQLACRIGGITFGLIAEEDLLLTLDPELREFAVQAGSCDVDLRISWSDTVEVPTSEPLFHSGGLWSLFAEPDGYRFSFQSAFLGKAPYKEAWVCKGF